MMPQTVPSRPMNGPAEPTVASTRRWRSSRSISRAMVTSITFSMRICRPPIARLVPSNERFHSRIAATNSAAHRMRRTRRLRAVKLFERMAGPEGLLELVHRALGAAVEQGLVDHDRPDPDRGEQQPDHHGLHDEVRRHEQAEQRQFGRRCDRRDRRHCAPRRSNALAASHHDTCKTIALSAKRPLASTGRCLSADATNGARLRRWRAAEHSKTC